MSSSNFESTIDLSPRPSIRALQWLFWLHVVPIVAVGFAVEPGTPLVLLLAAFALSWIWLRRHPSLGFGPRALTRLIWHAEGHWTLQEGSGRRFDAELQLDSYVHPRLIVLNFKPAGARRRTRVLLGDELDAELLRKLRARLLLVQGSPTKPN